MITRIELLSQLKKAVEKRESGQTEVSGMMFLKILELAESFKKSTNSEDQNTYIKVTAEYVIQLRHEGKNTFNKALRVAKELYTFNTKKNLKNSAAIRAVSNTLLNLEGYEIASRYLHELVSITPKNDSARLGDAMAHLARCNFRMGLVDKAEGMINEALFKIDKNTGHSSSLEISAWKSHALAVKAMILNSKGDMESASVLAQSALNIAKRNNVVPRIIEINELIKYLKSGKNIR